jgi:hypothetical protein
MVHFNVVPTQEDDLLHALLAPCCHGFNKHQVSFPRPKHWLKWHSIVKVQWFMQEASPIEKGNHAIVVLLSLLLPLHYTGILLGQGGQSYNN